MNPSIRCLDAWDGALKGVLNEIKESMSAGIHSIVLFPAIEDNLKTTDAKECFNENGLVQRSIKTIKDSFPELSVITDVALDPYNLSLIHISEPTRPY